MSVLALALGLVLLVLGGDWLVRGAVALAGRTGLSNSVIGLTVVAAGTSMPELGVSVTAAFTGAPDLSYGNVVGSNVYNVLLILGVAALIRPMKVRSATLRQEWPLMLVASVWLHVLATDGVLGRVEGAAMAATLVLFVTWTVRRSWLTPEQLEEALPAEVTSSAWALWLVAVGIAALIAGSQALVYGAVDLAAQAGVSQRVVGLTVVALGTSLPELFATVIAARRGYDDIAIANVVGSNLFNILGILGVTTLIRPIPVQPAFGAWDDWWMIGAALVLLPLMATGMRLERWEGGVLLTGAMVYTISLYA